MWYYKVKLLTRPFAFCQEAHSSCLTSGMKLSICGAQNDKNIPRTVCMLPVAKAVPQPPSPIPFLPLASSGVSAGLRKKKRMFTFKCWWACHLYYMLWHVRVSGFAWMGKWLTFVHNYQNKGGRMIGEPAVTGRDMPFKAWVLKTQTTEENMEFLSVAWSGHTTSPLFNS